MQEHTRRHHTNPNLAPSKNNETPMSLDEALHELSGDLPHWAIALRGLRRREGLTQVEIGKMLGIPQGNLSQMEHGKRPIGKTIAKRLAELFKTDYRLFL